MSIFEHGYIGQKDIDNTLHQWFRIMRIMLFPKKGSKIAETLNDFSP